MLNQKITSRQRAVQEQKLKSAISLLEVAVLQTQTDSPDELSQTVEIAVGILKGINDFLKSRPVEDDRF